MTRIIYTTLAIACLAGCAGSQYQSPDAKAAFYECNKQASRDWAARPHLAAVFGLAGALVDSSVTGSSAGDQLAKCMSDRGYSYTP